MGYKAKAKKASQVASKTARKSGQPEERPPVKGLVFFFLILFFVALAAMLTYGALSGGPDTDVLEALPTFPAGVNVNVDNRPDIQMPNIHIEQGDAGAAAAIPQLDANVQMVGTAAAMRADQNSAAIATLAAQINPVATAAALRADESAAAAVGTLTAQLEPIATSAAAAPMALAQAQAAAADVDELRADVVGAGVAFVVILLVGGLLATAGTLLFRRFTSLPQPQVIDVQPARRPELEPAREPVRTGGTSRENGSRTVLRTPNGSNGFSADNVEKLDATRPPSARERAVIRGYYHKLKSLSAVAKLLYGYKNQTTFDFVKNSVEEVLQ